MPHKDPEKRREYQREYQRRWARENRDRRLVYERSWNEHNREKRREISRRQKQLNAQKIYARNTLRRNLQLGRIVKGPCEACGTTEDVQAHHDDYSKPLDVQWLCRKHHGEVHRTA